MKKATIQNGFVVNCLSIDQPGVLAPNNVEVGDTYDGLNFYRDGKPVIDPGYNIQIGEMFTEITDAELDTLILFMFPAMTQPQRGAFAFTIRALAQVEIHSENPRLPKAKLLFKSILGETRMEQLFRER